MGSAFLFSARVWTLKKSGDNTLDFIIPKEGIPLIPYHLQMSKAGPDLEAVLELAKYAGGIEPAQNVADSLGYFPVNDDAKWPADFREIMGVSIDEYKSKLRQMDYIQIGKTRQQVRDQVDQINAKFSR